jgi:hypothetical protein
VVALGKAVQLHHARPRARQRQWRGAPPGIHLWGGARAGRGRGRQRCWSGNAAVRMMDQPDSAAAACPGCAVQPPRARRCSAGMQAAHHGASPTKA